MVVAIWALVWYINPNIASILRLYKTSQVFLDHFLWWITSLVWVSGSHIADWVLHGNSFTLLKQRKVEENFCYLSSFLKVQRRDSSMQPYSDRKIPMAEVNISSAILCMMDSIPHLQRKYGRFQPHYCHLHLSWNPFSPLPVLKCNAHLNIGFIPSSKLWANEWVGDLTVFSCLISSVASRCHYTAGDGKCVPL